MLNERIRRNKKENSKLICCFIQKISFQNTEEVYEEIVKTEERKLRFFNSQIHKYKEVFFS